MLRWQRKLRLRGLACVVAYYETHQNVVSIARMPPADVFRTASFTSTGLFFDRGICEKRAVYVSELYRPALRTTT